MKTSFNPTLVRLAPLTPLRRINRELAFQSHLGSISTCVKTLFSRR